jgi:NitT/TauT family transport system ATP-binding protein
MPGAAMEVRRVSKSFRSKALMTHALSDVNLSIGSGEFVALLGPSGCGKSTLLRVLGGLLPPDTGAVTVGSTSAAAARLAKQFGLIPQAPALVPWKTVEANIAFLASLNPGVRSPTMHPEQVDELIRAVGLNDVRRSYPHELSGGMQQRVSLVRGFALGAPVLLMDEPFAALDEITRGDARYLLLDLWARTNTTVVFVTHSIPEAVTLADRVVVMAARPGRIASIETIGLARPRRPETEDTPEFHEHVRRLRTALRDSHAH